MSTSVTYNGQSFTIPAIADASWGTNVSNYLIALATGSLTKSAGQFTLTADLDFGSPYGVLSNYFTSRSANPALTGVFRLSNADAIKWRNAANSADLAFGPDTNNLLKYGSGFVAVPSVDTSGVTFPTTGVLVTEAASETLTNKTIVAGNNTISGLLHGTHVDNPTTNVHGVTGTIVGTSDQQILTNKDIDGGTASNTNRVTIPSNTTTNLTGLTRKQGTVVYDTTTNSPKYDDGSALNSFGGPSDANRNQKTLENIGISCSVGSNALTIALKDNAGSDPSSGSPVKISFRSATRTDGSYVVRSISSALSVVVPASTTLGTSNGVTAALNVYAIDNAGTVVLGVCNGGFDENFVQSSTAISGGNTSGVLYSTSAQTSKAIRWIGRVLVTEATAGTWVTAPADVSVNPTNAPTPGRTDGVAPTAGMIGETITGSGASVATNTSTPTTIASITLTTGVWMVSAQGFSDSAATQTGASDKLIIKGSGGTTVGVDFIYTSGPVASAQSRAFVPRVVTVSSSDSDKTVVLKQTSLIAAGSGYGYISAVRIA